MTTFGNPSTGDTSSPRQLPVSPASNNRGILGWTACILTIASVTLMMTGDPFGLALVCAVLAVAGAFLALRRGQIDHVGTQLGLNLGVFLVIGWFAIRIVNAFLATGAPPV